MQAQIKFLSVKLPVVVGGTLGQKHVRHWVASGGHISLQTSRIVMMNQTKPSPKVVHILDPDTGEEKKVKLRNQASLSDFLRNTGIGFLRDAESKEALYTDDFDDFVDGRTYLCGTQKIEEKVNTMRRERSNVIKGDEDELAEALLGLFRQRGMSLENRPELRALSRREVDSVLIGKSSVVIGFYCTKLDEGELQEAFDKVSGMQKDAAFGDEDLAYLLNRSIYVAQMATWIPPEDLPRLQDSAKRKRIILLKKNGNNFCMRSTTPVQTFS
eukprot:TRINITY_DN423_c0_g1_i1.p1 TRINITY_DN423_c0_g1~~TRINITY_DN423_c0_g1_i1.p1  ORF type:complete len:271 (+),score=44.98 TRINITY_DN423_c0_g1_i1:103-915(+)